MLIIQSSLVQSKSPLDSYVFFGELLVNFKEHNSLQVCHVLKIPTIGSNSIFIVCTHTECALTAICCNCIFSQSNSMMV